MFVVSLSSKRFKKISAVVLSACVAVVCIAVVLLQCGKTDSRNESLSVNNSASDTAEILRFISNFGWEVNPEPDEIREIIIPVEFDEVYKSYNEIQLSQGYDLSDYSGERAKNWTFTVLNYPGLENVEYIKINILVYEGKVIGGDVCSVKLDGFMHGFSKE